MQITVQVPQVLLAELRATLDAAGIDYTVEELQQFLAADMIAMYALTFSPAGVATAAGHYWRTLRELAPKRK